METLLDLLRTYEAPAEIVDLVERLAAAQPPQGDTDGEDGPAGGLLEWPEGTEPLTNDELAQLDTYLVGLADDDDAPYELLVEAASAKDLIVTEQDVREQVADAAEAERQAAVAALKGDTPDTSGSGSDDTGPADEAGDGGDVEAGESADSEADGGHVDAESVAASAGGRGRPVSRAELLRNRPRRRPDPEPPEPPGTQLSRFEFAHDVPSVPAGHTTDRLSDVDRALADKRATWRATRPRKDGVIERLRVASLRGSFPTERRLVDDDGKVLAPSEISHRIQTAIRAGINETRTQHGGLLAACGLCAPATPIYSLETYGMRDRPIRDQALVSFQGPARGRVVAMTPPTLPDLSDAVSIWTLADDEAACDPDDPYATTKPCARVECGDEIGCDIHAIPLCLTMGNFLARTYSELQDAWTDLAMVAQARLAEQVLFAEMVAQSTTVATITEQVSAVRDVLVALDLAASGIRSRNRMREDDPMVVILPETFRGVARSDIARQMPGGPTQGNLVVAAMQIDEWFRNRYLSVVWSPDIDMIGEQDDGAPLAAWPSEIDALIYPAGTFIHVDGGVLDLGVVRDTATNAVNDFQIFSESFECVLKLGPESLHLDIEVCPSGAVNGTLDPTGFCAAA